MAKRIFGLLPDRLLTRNDFDMLRKYHKFDSYILERADDHMHGYEWILRFPESRSDIEQDEITKFVKNNVIMMYGITVVFGK